MRELVFKYPLGMQGPTLDEFRSQVQARFPHSYARGVVRFERSTGEWWGILAVYGLMTRIQSPGQISRFRQSLPPLSVNRQPSGRSVSSWMVITTLSD